MKLKNIKITDKNPLLIQFGAYAKWDGPKDIISPREEGPDLIHFLDEEIFEILEHSKILKILEYFAKICTPNLSPQCLFRTEKVDYVSLILEYPYKPKKIKRVIERVIKKLSELSGEKIENKEIIPYISWIVVSYPRTWNVEYSEWKFGTVIISYNFSSWRKRCRYSKWGIEKWKEILSLELGIKKENLWL